MRIEITAKSFTVGDKLKDLVEKRFPNSINISSRTRFVK